MIETRLRTTLALCFAALLASGAAACFRATPAGTPASEAAAADRATFSGVYEMGPDRSAFIPCGSVEQWYVEPQGSAARELRRLTNTQDLQSPAGGMVPAERSASVKRAYAEVQGDTVAVTPGRPALTHQRDLRVTRVVVVRPAQGALCP
jgi:hypothetical protein